MRAPRLALLSLSLLPGCDALWSGFRVPHAGCAGAGDAECRSVTFPARPAADVLFVIDNSPGMRQKQVTLLERVGPFFEALEKSQADYHVGVVSTDVGSWPEGQSFAPFRGCGSAAGDDGAMQGRACTGRSLSPESAASCAALCPDPSYVPSDNLPFIYKAGGYGNVTRVDENGVDRGPTRAFRCIAMLGDGGCDVEGPLEAARRALDGHRTENAQFHHAGGALAVIMLTDEDDCSVQAARRDRNDPAARRNCLGQPDDDYRCFNPDFRCFTENVTCAEPLSSAGQKSGCQERTASYLEPLDSYAQFLKGLRPERKLLVGGIWSPRLGAGDTKLVVTTEPGGSAADSFDLNRSILPPDASCSYTYNGNNYATARPQLRLSRFLSQFQNAVEISVCAPVDQSNGMARLGARLASVMTECLDFVPRQAGGQARCVVGDVPAAQTDQEPAAPMSQCSEGCCAAWAASAEPSLLDATVAAACQAEAADCFCAVKSQQAQVCAGGALAAVVRKAPAAEGRALRFSCAPQ